MSNDIRELVIFLGIIALLMVLVLILWAHVRINHLDTFTDGLDAYDSHLAGRIKDLEQHNKPEYNMKPQKTPIKILDTPYTYEGMIKFDSLPPQQAIVRAWTELGNHPEWGKKCKDNVRRQMPVLAHNLDRLCAEYSHGAINPNAERYYFE